MAAIETPMEFNEGGHVAVLVVERWQWAPLV
eukprot:CAMPEP_0171650422 /NCGR_PEP_ID=MMETSP0990-20121206/37589_1 /TAXON_ID=483369 /ORGANISM="non described non described, Strain CCMP2098" /LENGTH=30 /DNA_ID= /DNA_START= /DNA_END= /DNA_ORIENTATION=